MIAVAFIALAMGGNLAMSRWVRISDGYRDRAERYGSTLRLYEAQVLIYRRGIDDYRCEAETPRMGHPEEIRYWKQRVEIAREDEQRAVRWVNYCSIMQAKYRRAARYPWLSIGPDASSPDS